MAIAAKKTIVSSERAILRAPPPPGRTTSASATSATTPNLAAVFTRKSVAPLADRPAGHQDQHQGAEDDAVLHKNDRRVRREIAQEKGDRHVPHHECQEGRHD